MKLSFIHIHSRQIPFHFPFLSLTETVCECVCLCTQRDRPEKRIAFSSTEINTILSGVAYYTIHIVEILRLLLVVSRVLVFSTRSLAFVS